MVDKDLARTCLRAIDAGYACSMNRDRNRAMARQMPEFSAPDGAPPSCGGKSIIELIWDELLQVYGEILNWDEPMGWRSHEDAISDAAEQAGRKGQALGLATALALLINPYDPNIDAVRTEAAERWQASQA